MHYHHTKASFLSGSLSLWREEMGEGERERAITNTQKSSSPSLFVQQVLLSPEVWVMWPTREEEKKRE